MSELKSYPVWDESTRLFHWINALCVIALVCVGLVILNAGSLGVSKGGKVALKSFHVWVGYLFALNIFWRLVWAFMGNQYARWRAILPGGRGFMHALRSYVASFVAGQPQQYLGHNPLARIGVTVLLILVIIMAVTGLVLAGTDLFYPPFGHWFAKWIAAPGVDPSTLVPSAREMYDAEAYKSMRAFRKPFIVLHLYSFYILAGAIVLHVAAVVFTEIKEGGSIISAMFTGRKILDQRPEDEEYTDKEQG
jgi:cytochrome b